MTINSLSNMSRFLPELKQTQPRNSQKLPADTDISAETADANSIREDINRLVSEQADKFRAQDESGGCDNA